jgi:glycosyltransferase involved in cell wall biosynthesis
MRIAVVAAITRQGAQRAAEGLYEGMIRSLAGTSHQVEKIDVIIDESSFEKILESYVTCYDLDLREYDLVISTRAPTYMVRHPSHISYLLHTIRVFYDMFHSEFGTGTPDQHKQRRLIHAFDAYGLHPNRVRKHFAIGFTPYKRLSDTDPSWRQIAFEVLHPPPYRRDFKEPQSGTYVFVPGRLHRWQRVDLVIKAFKHIKQDIPLKITGTGEDEVTLRALAAADPRVEFLGQVSDDQLVDLYAGALVVPFVPVNEDYALITIEAFRSKKPVITCTDAGEPAHFVKNFETGFVVAPDPEAIAAKIHYFIDHPDAGVAMGAKGFAAVSQINWDAVSSRLLASINDEDRMLMGTGIERKHSDKPCRDIKILVAGHQVLDPPVGGSKLGIHQLYRHLAQFFSVTYVGACEWPGSEYREQTLAPNFTEVVVPLTQVQFGVNAVLERLASQKALIDVTMPLLLKYTPRFSEVVNSYAEDAGIIIISYPWVFPYVHRKMDQLLIYDAQGCEYLVKREILGKSLVTRLLLRLVKKTEGLLCHASDLIFARSQEDKNNLVQIYGVQEKKVFLIPYGVDIDEIRPAGQFERQTAKAAVGLAEQKAVLFVGSNDKPSCEAADFIVRVLAQELPDLQFLIMGGVADPYLHALRSSADLVPKNVKFFGTVDEEARQSLYRASDVAINPMFSGSGTNSTILTYMAAGIPVITTPRGGTGIMITHDTCIVCEAADFAKNIQTTLDNKIRSYEMSKNAREFVADKFDWKILVKRAYSAIQSHLETI